MTSCTPHFNTSNTQICCYEGDDFNQIKIDTILFFLTGINIIHLKRKRHSAVPKFTAVLMNS